MNTGDCRDFDLPYRRIGTNSGFGPPNRLAFRSTCVNYHCTNEFNCTTDDYCDRFSWSQRTIRDNDTIVYIDRDFTCDFNVCTQHDNERIITPAPTPSPTPVATASSIPFPNNVICYQGWKYYNDFDISGFNLTFVQGNYAINCQSSCNDNPNCHGYSWNSITQTCYLKTSGASQGTVNYNVFSAYKCENNPSPTPAPTSGPFPDVTCFNGWEYHANFDILQNDIYNEASNNPSLCHNLCENYNGCEGYTWAPHYDDPTIGSS